MTDLEKAEQLMKLYRKLDGVKDGWGGDLEGLLRLVKVWAKSAGYKLETRVS